MYRQKYEVGSVPDLAGISGRRARVSEDAAIARCRGVGIFWEKLAPIFIPIT